MADLLVDTDVLVDHLRGSRRFRAGRNRVHYSIVTRCELFAGRGSEEEIVRRVLSSFSEIALDRSIAESAGRIRREVGVSLPDAIIAASAIAFEIPLLTRNRRDFDRVQGLRVRSPAGG